MRLHHIIVGVVALVISSNALASEWWLVDLGGSKPKRTVVLIDKETLRPLANGKVRAWSWQYFEDQSDGVVTEKALFEFDCNEQSMRTISYINYGRSDDVVGSKTLSVYASPFEPIAPSTVGSSELAFVCQNDVSSASKIGTLDNFRIGGAKFLASIDKDETPPAIVRRK